MERHIETFTSYSGFNIRVNGVKCVGITFEKALPWPSDLPPIKPSDRPYIVGSLISLEKLPWYVKSAEIYGEESYKGIDVYTAVKMSDIFTMDKPKEYKEGFLYMYYSTKEPLVIREAL